MRHARFLPLLLPMLALAACRDEQPPTAPTESAGPAAPALGPSAAGHLIVNSLADPGDGSCTAAQCTLREAINDPGSTTIRFAPGLTGPITLSGTLVMVAASPISPAGSRSPTQP